jgi:hypothetical protein
VTTRRSLIAGTALVAAAGTLTSARAQAKQTDFRFVRNAASMSYANDKLTLNGVSLVPAESRIPIADRGRVPT